MKPVQNLAGYKQTHGFPSNCIMQKSQFGQKAFLMVFILRPMLDAYRCNSNLANQLPSPIVVPELTDGGELIYDQSEWEQSWIERVGQTGP